MTRRGALLFAAMCVIWGIPYLMIRVAVRELAPVTLVFLRTGLAAALLVPLAARRAELRPLLGRWRPRRKGHRDASESDRQRITSNNRRRLTEDRR